MTRPVKHSVNNYDYSKFDNKVKCKKPPIICPKCLEKEHKVRYGHKTEFLKTDPYIWNDAKTHLLARVVIAHCHFALYKGTQAPAMADARNAVCDIDTKWKDAKRECYLSYHIDKKEKKPAFTKSDD